MAVKPKLQERISDIMSNIGGIQDQFSGKKIILGDGPIRPTQTTLSLFNGV